MSKRMMSMARTGRRRVNSRHLSSVPPAVERESLSTREDQANIRRSEQPQGPSWTVFCPPSGP